MALTAQESTFEELAEGIYTGILREWEETDHAQYGPGVKIIFALPEVPNRADGTPETKWAFPSQKLTPRSKLWAICKALGREPVMGESYELNELLDPLVGAQCSLVIKHDEAGKAKILDYLAIRQAATKGPKA